MMTDADNLDSLAYRCAEAAALLQEAEHALERPDLEPVARQAAEDKRTCAQLELAAINAELRRHDEQSGLS
jgi:hypothetical protein